MYGVGRQNEAVAEMSAGAKAVDIETLFRVHYAGLTRMIGRVVRDRGRAEELAGEVFLKLWRKGIPEVDNVDGWLYRVAVNAGLDDLRKEMRRTRYERLLRWARTERSPETPEEVLRENEQKGRVRSVLGALPKKQAELLLLRSQGFSYSELGSTLSVNSASVGVLLARAREIFRKEYIKRYGEE
jgi:RNA polymerase sigma-70 factor, ECF subfamily